MLLESIKKIPNSTQIKFICDKCQIESSRTLGSIRASWYNMGLKEEWCTTCSRKLGASKRPQNTKEFLRKAGESEAYYKGIKNRVSSGENNPMHGKKHSIESRVKMCKSMVGKVGSNAPAWKGGKTSFNRRIKGCLQRRYKWFHRVKDRDCCCIKCGATKKLDAHHIKPISKIIKTLLLECKHLSEIEQYEFIINHPDIVDDTLINGMTLCRPCHKIEHKNWGSHVPI